MFFDIFILVMLANVYKIRFFFNAHLVPGLAESLGWWSRSVKVENHCPKFNLVHSLIQCNSL